MKKARNSFLSDNNDPLAYGRAMDDLITSKACKILLSVSMNYENIIVCGNRLHSYLIGIPIEYFSYIEKKIDFEEIKKMLMEKGFWDANDDENFKEIKKLRIHTAHANFLEIDRGGLIFKLNLLKNKKDEDRRKPYTNLEIQKIHKNSEFLLKKLLEQLEKQEETRAKMNAIRELAQEEK